MAGALVDLTMFSPWTEEFVVDSQDGVVSGCAINVFKRELEGGLGGGFRRP